MGLGDQGRQHVQLQDTVADAHDHLLLATGPVEIAQVGLRARAYARATSPFKICLPGLRVTSLLNITPTVISSGYVDLDPAQGIDEI